MYICSQPAGSTDSFRPKGNCVSKQMLMCHYNMLWIRLHVPQTVDKEWPVLHVRPVDQIEGWWPRRFVTVYWVLKASTTYIQVNHSNMGLYVGILVWVQSWWSKSRFRLLIHNLWTGFVMSIKAERNSLNSVFQMSRHELEIKPSVHSK